MYDKHIIGNTPRCSSCMYYEEKTHNDKTIPFCKKRNWCIPHNCGCSYWIDRETGLTYYEVQTHVPEPKRTPMEIELLKKYIIWRERK